MARTHRRAGVLATALFTAACTVGPNYQPPSPALPPAFVGPLAPAADSDGVDLAQWWQAYHDPELTRLIAIGLRQSPDLQTAASRVRQARFQIIEARAQGLPSVTASAGAMDIAVRPIGSSDLGTLVQQVTGEASGSGGAKSSLPNNLALFSAGFDASWEVDLFGGVRRQVEASRAQEAAAQWTLRDARVTLAAEIASDYVQLRGYQEQARLQQAEADRQARAADLLVHTAQVGLVPNGDAYRQNTQVSQARAQVAPLQAQAQTMTHALAALVGETPEALAGELDVARPLPAVPPEVPPGLPVDLIRRRPDVRAAERQLAAATADIGVAVADLYPKLSLSLMPELTTGWIGSFFIGKSAVLSSQGQLAFPVFDFGRRRAVVGERREQREQAYIAWRKTVLGALRDVEDALVNIAATQQAHDHLVTGVANARAALATVDARYRVGLQSYSPVLDSQQSLLQLETALARNDVQLRVDTAAYYKALGGGWSQDDAMPLRPVIADAPKRK
jgi:NodT family efflux transporter outer membrane factor (OMF) lipoprotein